MQITFAFALDYSTMDLPTLQKYAKAGSAKALSELGWRCMNEKDYINAAIWLKESAEKGNPNAQVNYGFLHEKGFGVEQNYKEACKWYKSAADQNNKTAQCNLGNMYRFGYGVEKNIEEARKLYSLSADKGYVKAMFQIGYLNYSFDPINYDLAYSWFQKAAKLGNVDAIVYVGLCYEYGRGVPKDYKQSFQCYKRAADSGDKYGIMNLARLHKAGKGIPQNDKEAFELYKSAANKGLLDANLELFGFYVTGTIVEKNENIAFKLVKECVDAGFTEAYLNMGDCYAQGLGTPKDTQTAIKYYKMALESKNDAKFAKYYLGLIYSESNSNELNFKEAIKWLELAAEENTVNSQFILATVFNRIHDSIQTYKWIKIDEFVNKDPGTYDDKYLCGVKRDLEAFMTSEQIAQATKLAETWIQEHK